MLPRVLPSDPARLLLLWLIGRLITAIFVIGAPFIPSLGAYNDDVELYLVWARDIASGRFPFDDAMWQYPPLAGVLFYAAYALTPHSISGFVMLALAADALITFMLLRASNTQGLALWVITPALVGPVMLGRFDVFPAAFAVAAVFAVTKYPRLGAAFIAAGSLLKVWPALILAAVRRPWRIGATVAGISAGVIALVLPFTGGALSFIEHQQQRGIQIESIWALPYLIAKMLGASIDVPYQYGAREISATGTALFATMSTLLTLLAVASIAVLRWMGRLDQFSTADVTLMAVLASVIFSRVISPQYAVWILALAATTLACGNSALREVITLLMWWSFLGFVLYPFLYNGLRDGFVLSVGVQAARTWLLLKAGALIVHQIRSGSRPSSIDLRRAAGVSQVQFSNTQDRPA